MMGFGNWEDAQDTTQMHISRAEKENIDIENAEILEVDNHALHVEAHTRFIISGQVDNRRDYREKVLAHVRAHKKAMESATPSVSDENTAC